MRGYRDPRFSNLKFLLMFFVVYGHFIEPTIYQSPAAITQYKLIYFFHMPLFVFLSGLFMKDISGTRRHLTKILPLYLLLQGAALLWGGDKVIPKRPYWHLWYLFSLVTWLCFAWFFFRVLKGRFGFTLLIFFLLLGLAAGFIPWIDRDYSLSRTLVFLPYFWAGLLMDKHFDFRKLFYPALCLLMISTGCIILWGRNISVSFLYQASPYSVENGAFLRLLCYLVGGSISLFFLTIAPKRAFFFTPVGDTSLWIYLLHAPVAIWLKCHPLPWYWCLLLTPLILFFSHLVRLGFLEAKQHLTKSKA